MFRMKLIRSYVPKFSRRLPYSSSSQKTVEMIMREKLTKGLEPLHLEIQNESKMHNVPKNSETHFRVQVISSLFENKTLLMRHRMINDILKEELSTVVHALAIEALTPDQWQKYSQKIQVSPPCRGGMALENNKEFV
ncbi:putative bolA-like protein K11H12.1 isoform X3 [Centruroides vittatus]|uniref:putative bolA-like protein K11H12.1 isoform X3 n=1 Tax=Centruroides vittatus TaxID=120091 RepID=UPI003510875A